jgi:hypothetical protein
MPLNTGVTATGGGQFLDLDLYINYGVDAALGKVGQNIASRNKVGSNVMSSLPPRMIGAYLYDSFVVDKIGKTLGIEASGDKQMYVEKWARAAVIKVAENVWTGNGALSGVIIPAVGGALGSALAEKILDTDFRKGINLPYNA